MQKRKEVSYKNITAKDFFGTTLMAHFALHSKNIFRMNISLKIIYQDVEFMTVFGDFYHIVIKTPD